MRRTPGDVNIQLHRPEKLGPRNPQTLILLYTLEKAFRNFM
jgi:hypothetical protein